LLLWCESLFLLTDKVKREQKNSNSSSGVEQQQRNYDYNIPTTQYDHQNKQRNKIKKYL